MSEVCGECRGEGDVWDDRDGRYRFCMNCGGEGRIDPYEQDEWYDEDYEDGYDDDEDFTDGNDVTQPSPIGDSDHDHA